jgi:hypothetical protein
MAPVDETANGRNDAAELDPDDPLLARAQQALKKQLSETRQRVEEELREKTKLLADARQRKEDLGVSLFNFQQQLANLQVELEKSHETQTKVAAQKNTVAQRVQEVNSQYDEELSKRQNERLRADKLQEELDMCAPCPELECASHPDTMHMCLFGVTFTCVHWNIQAGCYSAPDRGISHLHEAGNCCHTPCNLQSRGVYSES